MPNEPRNAKLNEKWRNVKWVKCDGRYPRSWCGYPNRRLHLMFDDIQMQSDPCNSMHWIRAVMFNELGKWEAYGFFGLGKARLRYWSDCNKRALQRQIAAEWRKIA